MANPDADFDALMAEMGELQTELDNANAWDIDTRLEQAMDALQCPQATPLLTSCQAVSGVVSRYASC